MTAILSVILSLIDCQLKNILLVLYEDCHFKMDYLVLTPFICKSLPILNSPITSVLTNDWINLWDVTFVLIITLTANGTCAGPLIATLVYDGHCVSYPTGPSGAIMITMGGNFLFNMGPVPPTTIQCQQFVQFYHSSQCHQVTSVQPYG